jgi:hypothetical protein
MNALIINAPAGRRRREASRWGQLGSLMALVFCLMLVPAMRGADAPAPKEHQVKAAFIYNFLKFVEWPAEKFADTNAPIIIGVAKAGPLSAALEATVKDRKINGRAIVVRPAETSDAARLHLFCFTGMEEARLLEAMAAFTGKRVLTVGDTDKFAQSGGMIIFMPETDKLRFEINVDAAEREGLKISAQLQKLAKSIRRQK